VFKKLMALFTALVLVVFLPACSTAPTTVAGPQKYEAEFLELFDTLTTLVGYADSKVAFEAEAAAVKADLLVYHQLYDIYHSYPGITNMKDLNDKAGQGPVKVDQKIIDLLKFGQYAYTLSGGQVNIAFGAVLRIWHDYREAGLADPANAQVPDLADLQKASQHTAITDMVIDEVNQTVELKDPGMRLDVGAIAKGYATEMAARAAMARGVKHLLMSVGGNVRAIGYRNDTNEVWRVGIENPEKADSDYLSIVSIHDLSVVTSGVYERYYEVNGKRYHHVIDPDTLFPENNYLSVTILTEDSGLADALSTALFNMSYEEGLALIESLGNTEALWCYPDGSLKESPGFSQYVKN
jgi:FAD:protein FMN transferase